MEKPNVTQVNPMQQNLAEKIEEAHREANRMPVCPYCGDTAGTYSFRQFEAGPWMAVQIFCGNRECRKLFNVQITGPSPQAIRETMQQRTGPRILAPR